MEFKHTDGKSKSLIDEFKTSVVFDNSQALNWANGSLRVTASLIIIITPSFTMREHINNYTYLPISDFAR